MNHDAFVARLASVTDEDAAAMVSEQAMTELAEQVTAVPAAPRHRVSRPWRLRTAAVSAVGVAVAVIAAAVVTAGPGRQVPAVRGSHTTRLAALIFTSSQGYIDVIIRNPYADPAMYRAEFAAHHLDITLLMVPGSPSIAGTLAYGGGDGVTVLQQPGRCTEPGGGACVIGVRIPDGFRGSTQLAFVRPARPGERYETTGQVTAPGEAMHGLSYTGRRVAAVLAMLARRHVTVGAYRVFSAAAGGGVSISPRSVPGDWYVTGADPYAPGQVLLVVSRTPHQPSAVCRPVHGLRCPTPTPHR